MRQVGRTIAFGILVVATGIAVLASESRWQAARAQAVADIDAHIVATNIPGASAIAQIGTFLNDATACAHPIPTVFPWAQKPGAVLDPKRILVGSTSNFGAPLATAVGREGSFLSIDPSEPGILYPISVPPDFANSGGQVSVPNLNGAIQMFSANSPLPFINSEPAGWLNAVNNPSANTAQYTGVSNPLGLSNNNGFGRIWPANAPFGEAGAGSSSILDPTGLPLAGAPNKFIGGVYAGSLTDRNAVTPLMTATLDIPLLPQVIPGELRTGAVGTALLGPSPDGTCKAVFAVVTADGAIVQEHTLYGLDGLAPAGTVRPVLGGNGNAQQEGVEPRFGVIMNPYLPAGAIIRQLFITEPFYDTIAIVNLTVTGAAPYQVFGLDSVSRIHSHTLNIPVDLTPVVRNTDDHDWASNTTLDDQGGSGSGGSDFYVANQGDNTIVRMEQNGMVVAIARVTVNGQPLDNVVLNGIAASTDMQPATTPPTPTTIFATFVDPNTGQGGVLAMKGF